MACKSASNRQLALVLLSQVSAWHDTFQDSNMPVKAKHAVMLPWHVALPKHPSLTVQREKRCAKWAGLRVVP